MDPRRYYPLVKGLRLAYRLDEPPDEPFGDAEVMEILDVRPMFPITRATCRRTTTSPYDAEVQEFAVESGTDGIYVMSRDPQLLIPIPLEVGASWKGASSGRWTVRSLTESVRVPAGEFTHCLLLGYQGGGDDGAQLRLAYAPGVGLVSRHFSNEARDYSLELTGHNLPDDFCVLHLTADHDAIASPLIAALRGAGWLVSSRYVPASRAGDLGGLAESSTARHTVLIVSRTLMARRHAVSVLERVLPTIRFVVLYDLTVAEAVQKSEALGHTLIADSREGVPRLVERLSAAFDARTA